MDKDQRRVCPYICAPSVRGEAQGIKLGVKLEDFPEDWMCLRCEVRKSNNENEGGVRTV